MIKCVRRRNWGACRFSFPPIFRCATVNKCLTVGYGVSAVIVLAGGDDAPAACVPACLDIQLESSERQTGESRGTCCTNWVNEWMAIGLAMRKDAVQDSIAIQFTTHFWRCDEDDVNMIMLSSDTLKKTQTSKITSVFYLFSRGNHSVLFIKVSFFELRRR